MIVLRDYQRNSSDAEQRGKIGTHFYNLEAAMTDVIRSTLPKKENRNLAEDLLARFPGVDHSELLKSFIAHLFFDMRFGNKQEERAACDYLNEIQVIATRLRALRGDAE